MSCLSQPRETTPFPIEHYFAIFEGLKSWALVIEHHYGLGQQSWHEDLLRAVFRLAFLEGFLYAQNGTDVNLAAGCRYVLEELRREMHRTVAAEVLGETPGFGLRPVEIHLEFMTAAARWMMALKLWSVLSARMAMRLNSLSLQKKFSMR